MVLTCTKCGHKHPLSDEDVALFYPRFFCLACGTKLSFPMEETRYLELRRANDRDRLPPEVKALDAHDTKLRVRKEAGQQGTEGG